MKLDCKQKTKEAYDKYSRKFDEKFSNAPLRDTVKQEVNIFVKNLKGKKVLDLGSGPGNYAVYFKNLGLDVLCVDISEEMIKLCKEKGLNAEVMDLENLKLSGESFDGIWAYASLIHTPRTNLPKIAKKLELILRVDGILGLSLKEGKGEQFEDDEKFPGVQRYYVYYSDDEVRNSFLKYFDLVAFSRTNMGRYNFLNYLFKKKD